MARRFHALCDCGFDKVYGTEPWARRGLRTHSCAKQIRRAAETARGVLRRAAVDRMPKPCLHKRANHQHGAYATYVLDNCRCVPCSKSNSDYETRRQRQTAYGRWQPFVDAEPARAHVRSLMEAGMGLKRVVKVSGVSSGAMTKLIYGVRKPDGSKTPSRQIRRETAEALLALEPDLADHALVANVGTQRRLQALVTMGWSIACLGRRLGRDRANMTPLMRADAVTAATARAVRDLYERMADQAPPETTQHERISASRARNYAKANGWLAPVWWDDDLMDDPTYDPRALEPVLDELMMARALDDGEDVNHLLNRQERIEVVLRLHERGLNPTAIRVYLHEHINLARVTQIIEENKETAA